MPISTSARRLAALACMTLLLALSTGLAAQTTRPARTDVGADAGSAILWVGNSFC